MIERKKKIKREGRSLSLGGQFGTFTVTCEVFFHKLLLQEFGGIRQFSILTVICMDENNIDYHYVMAVINNFAVNCNVILLQF